MEIRACGVGGVNVNGGSGDCLVDSFFNKFCELRKEDDRMKEKLSDARTSNTTTPQQPSPGTSLSTSRRPSVRMSGMPYIPRIQRDYRGRQHWKHVTRHWPRRKGEDNAKTPRVSCMPDPDPLAASRTKRDRQVSLASEEGTGSFRR
ncbi:hypothetical protein P7K49_025786 [Saguinus oedipus]|uniref:Uncharacterized protein n=1 Tax=Saguinus oedipus TaxID=9490 RepID=A0ABQ9UI62_SAGOE|nr:hypothetical protein P7K49_025786 [Saguinus oedipus]